MTSLLVNTERVRGYWQSIYTMKLKLAPDEEDDRMDPASPGAGLLFVSGFVKSLFAVIY